MAVAIAVSAVTYGAASEAAFWSMADSGLASTYSVGALETLAGITGGAAEAMVGNATAQVLMTGRLDMGQTLKTGLSGAMSGGIGGYYGDSWNMERFAVNAAAGGLSSSFQGESISAGFGRALVTGGAKWIYTSQVGFDITPLPGVNPDTSVDKFAAKYDVAYGIPKGLNVFGKNAEIAGNWWELANIDKQGGLISRVGNALPLGNAIAGIHDAWMNSATPDAFNYLNFPTMLPAAILTITGSMNMPFINMKDIKR